MSTPMSAMTLEAIVTTAMPCSMIDRAFSNSFAPILCATCTTKPERNMLVVPQKSQIVVLTRPIAAAACAP